MERRLLFANISYRSNGQQQGKFRYVRETGDAGEKYNFEPVVMNNQEVCLGYFEAGYGKGGYEHGKQRQVHIEKLDISLLRSSPSIQRVTVIWCAFIEDINRASIIGWYTNADVFRRPIKLPYGDIPGRGSLDNEYVYNVIADKSNCVHLPFSEILNEAWYAPRSRTSGYGFGESNMWYAEEPEAKEYVDKVLYNINHYSGLNLIC